jgi:sarcosine oxidase
MDFLIVGSGMFGAATARYLAPHASVTVVGPEPSADGSGAYGAHHDEGRIIGDAGTDEVWSELNRRAQDGMTDLEPTLITSCGALTVAARDGATGTRTLTADAAHAAFPMARFTEGQVIMHNPGAGRFSPRRYVALALESAQRHGVTIISGTIRALRSSRTGTEVESSDGRRLRAGAAIVASGAFAAGSSLLPTPLALRAKSEIYVMAEVDDRQAAGLAGMPCINTPSSHPDLDDLYVLPPIRYPDGRTYLKVGAKTAIDRWLPDPAAVRAWYDRGNGAAMLPALRQALTSLLPGIRTGNWHARRCSDAYTAHRRPYIDVLEPGRLMIALGGNGRGAQAADAIGQLTASLALTGQWPSGLPSYPFRHVPAHGHWNGVTLLQEQGS